MVLNASFTNSMHFAFKELVYNTSTVYEVWHSSIVKIVVAVEDELLKHNMSVCGCPTKTGPFC